MLASPRLSADPCSAGALLRHLCHYNSNGSVSVALRLKCQSDTCCNLTVRKSDEHTKHCLVSLIQNFIHYYPSFVVAEREKTAWVESTTLDRPREISRREKRSSRHIHWYYLSRFQLLSLHELSPWFCLHRFAASVEPHSEAGPQSGCRNFRPVFTSPKFFPSWLYFLVFYLASPRTAFPFEFLPPNQNLSPVCCWYISILKLDVCCYPDKDLGTRSHHLTFQ